MDSCHLFNFLFGTKKATTELSKCFTSVVSSSSSSSSSSGRSSQSTTNNNERIKSQPTQRKSGPETEIPLPLSPLKQLQMKIASLAPGSKAKSSPGIKKNTGVTCDSQCGTYRATLVELSEDDHLLGNNQTVDDEDEKIDNHLRQKQREEVKIVENPLNIDKKEDLVLNGVRNGENETREGERRDNLENDQAFDTESMEHSSVLDKISLDKDDNSNNINVNIKTKQPARCKRVILYDESELKQHQLQNQQQLQQQKQLQQCQGQPIEPVKRQIVASAEVYNMVVGDNKEKRAELRRVSSFIPDEYINKNNNGNNKVNCRDEDSKGTEYHHPNRVDLKSVEPQMSETDEKFNLQQSEYDNNNNNISPESNRKRSCESLRDKRSVYVQSLVQSIELTGRFKVAGEETTSKDGDKENRRLNIGDNYPSKNINIRQSDELEPTSEIEFPQQQSIRIASTTKLLTSTINNTFTKPVTFVKPLPPPKTPVKTNRAKFLNMQISLNKPIKIQHLFQDETFLIKFFDKLEPLDRCVAAQVCRQWRNILYANQNYWKDLINVIDCTQLRRDYLVECIINTLQSAKSKQQKAIEKDQVQLHNNNNHRHHDGSGSIMKLPTSRLEQKQYLESSTITLQTAGSNSNSTINRYSGDSYIDFDQDDVWRIQELCNRYTQRMGGNVAHNRHQANNTNCNDASSYNSNNIHQSIYTSTNQENQQQQQQHCSASKSSSIPSQISSTLSSVSLSSLLSPLSESSRIESIKEKLYNSLDNRGFDAICLFGATDDDIEDLINKMPINAHKRITCGRLNNCCITNRGLDLFISTFTQIEEIQLSGCNEITNCFDLKILAKLKRLIITDCINIADGVAQKLIQIMHQLDELTIQAYHLTDAFIEYLGLNSDTSRLKRLELPNCKEITNQSIVTIAKYFPNLESLSISGSTKITDDGIEVLAEQARKLRSLDLSWCSRITDASLECIACDLGDTLTDLILDRNVHITDIGLGYLATMSKLTLLHIRWCPQITDVGLESILGQVKTLRYLSLAGIHQITARSLLHLIEADLLEEVELTNCPSVNTDLLLFLSTRLPKCNIIF